MLKIVKMFPLLYLYSFSYQIFIQFNLIKFIKLNIKQNLKLFVNHKVQNNYN